MTVIKRDKSASSKDLTKAIEELVDLLADQDEQDAIDALKAAVKKMQSAQPGTPDHKEAVNAIVDAFEGEHELNGYVLAHANADEWNIAQQLSQASSRVLNLARRLSR